jgi:hypothetical protein
MLKVFGKGARGETFIPYLHDAYVIPERNGFAVPV